MFKGKRFEFLFTSKNEKYQKVSRLGDKSAFIQPAIIFGLLLGLYFVACWPALLGPFVLDDWPNLAHLTAVKSWPDIWAYSFSGASSTIGRPIAYFSFAMQANDWPDNPFPFKLLNLFIHAVNSVLLYSCCYLFATHLNFDRKKKLSFSMLCALIWLFLPLHASSVFYVVQRMVLLAGFFTLLGLLAFLAGSLLDAKQYRSGRLLATFGVLIAYVLGILSKENAVLLGIFVAVLYFFSVRKNTVQVRVWWDAWIVVVALFPLLLTAIYLMWGGRFLESYKIREFTVEQRIYTEWRILWDYVSKITLPSAAKINLFNDDFAFSSSFLKPVTTAIAGLMWLFTFIAAFIFRKKYPFFLFGLVWFSGGHLLESTLVGLELYFEHRNYLPSIGIIIAVVWAGYAFLDWIAIRKSSRDFKVSQGVLVLSAVVYLAWSVLVLSQEAVAWSSQKNYVMAAIEDRPQSLRANQEVMAYFISTGEYGGASNVLNKIDTQWPDYPSTYAWMLLIQCLDPSYASVPDQKLINRFENGKFERGSENALYEIYNLKKAGGCEHLTWDTYRSWLHALMRNPIRPRLGHRENLFRLEIFSYMEEKNFEQASEAFDAHDELSIPLNLLKLKMQVLSFAGREMDALSLIQRIKSRFEGNRKLWAINGSYFSMVEKRIKAKLERVEGEKHEKI